MQGATAPLLQAACLHGPLLAPSLTVCGGCGATQEQDSSRALTVFEEHSRQSVWPCPDQGCSHWGQGCEGWVCSVVAP